MKQAQFLDVVDLETARARWSAALHLDPLPAEPVPLGEALGRTVAADVRAPGDVPAFDRSNVDGFAVQAADTFGAEEGAPRRLRAFGTPIDAGHAPADTLRPGHAWTIATGGVVPRGADAVVMVEHTFVEGDEVVVTRPSIPGDRISMAGSDVGRGETVVRAGTRLTARETATLAACGIGAVPCVRRPKVAVISTGDEIVPPGPGVLDPGQVHDANTTALADTVREIGGEVVLAGIAGDDHAALEEWITRAIRDADVILLSGGTSKGGGDLTYRVLEEQAEIHVHGVALKPGKPLCLAAKDGKAIAVLPGFPTSALFTFHTVVAPVLRRLLGRAEEPRHTLRATLPLRVRSERGRSEFNLVRLVRGPDGWLAFPVGKGSGSVTSFARADGFFRIAADLEFVEGGTELEVTPLGRDVRPADLVIVGSHCVGLDTVLGHLDPAAGLDLKVVAVGSRGGIEAARLGACHVAPIHLFDPEHDEWNGPFAPEGTRVVRGYGRHQGIAFRRADDARFAGDDPAAVIQAAARDPNRRIANRNRGSGTRQLLDALLGDAKPAGWATGYRSHTAVAAAIAQGRADWGICLAQAATGAGLLWRPWTDEQYDFLVPDAHWDTPGVVAFRTALDGEPTRQALRDQGFDA